MVSIAPAIRVKRSRLFPMIKVGVLGDWMNGRGVPVNLSVGLFRLYFSMFDDSLRSVVLDTEDGVGRIGRASEFMFMSISGHEIGFKHICSRNYVYMDRFSGSLRIPKTDLYFGRGSFDLGGWENPHVFDHYLKSKERARVLSHPGGGCPGSDETGQIKSR